MEFVFHRYGAFTWTYWACGTVVTVLWTEHTNHQGAPCPPCHLCHLCLRGTQPVSRHGCVLSLHDNTTAAAITWMPVRLRRASILKKSWVSSNNPSAPPPLNYSGFLIIPQPCRYSVERNFIPLWQSRRETVCATVCNTRVARFQGVCVCVWGRFYNSSFVGEGRSDFVAVLFFILPSREWSRKASDRAHLVVFPLVP